MKPRKRTKKLERLAEHIAETCDSVDLVEFILDSLRYSDDKLLKRLKKAYRE